MRREFYLVVSRLGRGLWDRLPIMDIEHTQSKVDFPCQKREHVVQEASAKAPSTEQIEEDFSMMRAVDTYKQTGKYPTGMVRTKKGLLASLQINTF